MTRILMTLALALMLAGPAKAQSEAIEGVIGAQIEAFRADDFGAAFDFASPTIRNIFRTPENFGRMVQQGYPMVWRPAEVQYLALEPRGGQMVQRVLVTDQNGGLHVLEYYMIQTENGWQIDGVSLLPAPDIGV